jgi:23S rRNA (guanine745-N1)-methyltransferase
MNLRCPLCREPLTAGEKSAACRNGHSFDRAREGYFNLLPVQNKNSLNPGDDAAMVVARTHFLEAGFYTPFRDTLKGVLAPLSIEHLLDNGCGEGWYSTELCKTAQKTTAFDISKEAIKRAAKRSHDIDWLVASSGDIPLLDASVDTITAIFSPVTTAEAARVLKPGGHLLIAAPGEKHLWELREALYTEVRAHQAEKWRQELAPDFHFHREIDIRFLMNLPDNTSIKNLLQMTPHYWRAPRERRTQVENLKTLFTQVDFRLLIFRKN